MCKLCDHRASRGVPVTDAVTQAAHAIVALYEVNGVGGHAHVVTDDMNIDDAHIAWCLAYNAERPHDEEYETSRAALLALQPLTRTQRLKAIHLSETVRYGEAR